MLTYNGDLKERSRQLRDNMTDAEKVVWARVRLQQINGQRFYRQKPIGDYIVDFFCPKAKLVIEIDGGQHFSKDMIDNDKIRDEFLNGLGLNVMRFTNSEVLNDIERVIEQISKIVEGKR